MVTQLNRPTWVLLVAAATVAGCSGSTDSGSDTVATASTTIVESATTVPETTAVPVETAAPTTVAVTSATTTAAVTTDASTAPAATTPPAAVAPTLRVDGVGPLVFAATTPEAADAYLAPLLGAPVSVVSSEYPDADGRGGYENPADESAFTFPYGRTVCYGNALCTHFGGADGAALTFVGYRQDEAAGSLVTASGVTAGSQGTDFPTAIVTEPGGCFSTGGGTADGVRLFLQSNGTFFTDYDDVNDEYINTAPPVAEVTVLFVFGGDEPYYLYEDC